MLHKGFITSTLLLFVIISIPTFAYTGDYVWEEKFRNQEPAARAGDAKAQYQIGLMYEKGRGVARDNKKAFQWYKQAAMQGVEKAQFKIGYAYLKGRGTAIDTEVALEWLQKAADTGYGRAYFYIGEMHEKGVAVEQDLETALSWYTKAKDSGFEPAGNRIARVTRNTQQQPSRASVKVKSVKKAKITSVSRRSSATVQEKLLLGGWKKRKKPAEYLPSEVADCKMVGRSIECLSKQLTRNIGMADINYTTKSIIYSIKKSGSFKISYRNNVIKVDITDPEFADSGADVPVKLGWQDTEHSLSCKIENDTNMVCKKNKLRKLKFHR